MSENYDTQVGHSLWVFLSCLNMCSGTSHDSTSYGGVNNEKTVWRKRILVTLYICMLYYSVMYWVYPSIYIWFCHFLCMNFVMPPSYFLLFINALIRLLTRAHFILGPKVTKRYVQIMNICNPWLYSYILVHARTYSYILEHTGIYSYILIHTIIQHRVLRIRLELPCYEVLSLLHACAMHCSQHPSFLWSLRWSGLPGGACHAQTATATGWPHRHCCPAVSPLQQRWHSHTGSLDPCACWICEGLLDSSYQPETMA